ncbi:Conserved hypothetical protein (plasmid) [Leptospira biflexa serovar Patoc strain 'Patoc 1 (Ames)']|uniref:Uncharacterized protein n=1 Tax=Leptospira biflexa serovar Patoc (strain Patoc 1 / ATCC 23582 / Paris) TaxID=456481 RepID=B0SUH0_LEPBP|nr:DUF167 domain-containing protein [Leptospira biflexa]ABZ96128.1 Conserved hypothetical protein [Leptospira biflexa serovar Patoc strain 'Patoc 1 (Ames)']ABZ99854.1 Conserved hypothetical protein [Leptospira biflexa serovar Patoc strain 'Patoc 1 (Paris)']
MKIVIKVKSNQKIQSLEFKSETECIAKLKSLPVKGKANQELVGLLSKHYGVTKKEIQIISGHFSNIKTVEILNLN